MTGIYIEGKKIEAINFFEKPLIKGEYENCTFNDCIFSNTDLSNIKFTECIFTGCNFTMANIVNTAFRDTVFKNCKLLGVHFENCNGFLFSAGFENCILNLSSFYQLKLKKTKFQNCTLHEVDFTESDLSNAIFQDCDLSGTIFENTILEKADLRTAYNYSINPELNQIKKAKFSIAGLPGLLNKYNLEIEN